MKKNFIIIFSLLLFGLPTFAENYDADGMPKSQYEINIEQAEKAAPYYSAVVLLLGLVCEYVLNEPHLLFSFAFGCNFGGGNRHAVKSE